MIEMLLVVWLVETESSGNVELGATTSPMQVSCLAQQECDLFGRWEQSKQLVNAFFRACAQLQQQHEQNKLY